MKILLILAFFFIYTIDTKWMSASQSQLDQQQQQINVKQTINTTQSLWPIPKKISSNSTAQDLQIDLFDIAFRIQAIPSTYAEQILTHYFANVFLIPYQVYQQQSKKRMQQKQKYGGQQITMNLIIRNSRQIVAQSVEHQKYQLTIRKTTSWDLIADYYPGFVRGFQTFSQLFQKQPNMKYIIRNRPILIDDQPDLLWRGLMIDTSRHYLPVQSIKKIIDGIMYNKMNVLHWHIIDQDSFPMEVPSRPELSKYGSLAGTYKPSDLKQIQNYANIRAIRVIPQYDTPAHTRSWGRSDILSSITFDGQNKYQGQFNPTINLTYQVVEDVAKYVNSIFTDRYVHLGGDEVDTDVWDQHLQVKKWMQENNIKDYDQLQIYYRKKQRQIVRQINSTKKAIYWANQQINLPVDPTDVIQWWGDTQNLDQIKKFKNQIILSNYDLAYLDVGFSDELGDPYQTYISWRDMYKFTPKIQGVNIIGGQACIWAQTTYEGNIQQKVWIRSSAMAQRLWNMDVDINKQILNVVTRLIEQKKRMQQRGYKTSPVTVGLCQKQPKICFG